MKKTVFFYNVMLVLLYLSACEKQNMPTPNEVKTRIVHSETYYENLRAYKKSDHQVFFAWIGNTGNPGSPDVPTVFEMIPDSVDIVSLWGSYPPINSHGDQMMKATQKLKGTKFVAVFFDDGNFLDRWIDPSAWDAAPKGQKPSFAAAYDTGDDKKLIEGFEIVAKNLSDLIADRQIDGIDFDHEPNLCGCDWGILKDTRKYNLFLSVVAQYFGPSSGKDNLFIVDGEYGMISAENGAKLSYIVAQAYGTGSPGSLQSRFGNTPSGFPPEKFIVTENFESYWSTGGNNYNDPVHGTIPSLLGMAHWQPVQGRKGGAGAYHAEYEYGLNPDYKYTREAIQIMNPAVN